MGNVESQEGGKNMKWCFVIVVLALGLLARGEWTGAEHFRSGGVEYPCGGQDIGVLAFRGQCEGC